MKVLRCDSLDPRGKHGCRLVLGAHHVHGSWEQRRQSLRVKCGQRGLYLRAVERVLEGF